MMLTSKNRNGQLIQDLYTPKYECKRHKQDVGVDTKKEFGLGNMFLFTHFKSLQLNPQKAKTSKSIKNIAIQV